MGGGERAWAGGGQVKNPNIWQPCFAFFEDELRLEGLGGGEHHFGAVGDEPAPSVSPRTLDGNCDQAEGAAAGVGANEEDSTGIAGDGTGMMVNVVFVIV